MGIFGKTSMMSKARLLGKACLRGLEPLGDGLHFKCQSHSEDKKNANREIAIICKPLFLHSLEQFPMSLGDSKSTPP